MKKFIIALSAMLVMSLSISAFAEGFDDVFNNYKKLEGAEYVKIPGFLMRLAGKMHEDNMKNVPVIGKPSGLRVLEIDNSSPEMLSGLIDDCRKAGESFGAPMSVAEDDERVDIWFDTDKKDVIRKIIILSSEGNEVSLVELSGKFRIKNNHE